MQLQHFVLFKDHKKKSINLKFKTKYTCPKKLAQQQKLPIVKLKKIKSNKPILSKTNNAAFLKISNKIIVLAQQHASKSNKKKENPQWLSHRIQLVAKSPP